MLTKETLEFIRRNLWTLTYEEVQQLHQVLVTEWTFDNPSTPVTILVAEAESLVRQRKMERRNPQDVRITDGDRVILRNEPDDRFNQGKDPEGVGGWKGMRKLLIEFGVTLSKMEDYPSGRRS